MEEVLGQPVPYWDWTEDQKVPDIFEGITVPVNNIVKCGCEPKEDKCGGESVAQNPVDKIENKLRELNLKTKVANAFLNHDFLKLQAEFKEVHNGVHAAVGCELGNQQTASYDPLFWLHHSFVDRVWAYYIELYKTRNRKVQI